MRKTDAIAYYQTQTALADKLGIKVQSITDWGEFVPYHWQEFLEKDSRGALKKMSGLKFARARKAACLVK